MGGWRRNPLLRGVEERPCIASRLFIDTVSRLAIAMILPSGHSV
jgi:hypothetical protein